MEFKEITKLEAMFLKKELKKFKNFYNRIFNYYSVAEAISNDIMNFSQYLMSFVFKQVKSANITKYLLH